MEGCLARRRSVPVRMKSAGPSVADPSARGVDVQRALAPFVRSSARSSRTQLPVIGLHQASQHRGSKADGRIPGDRAGGCATGCGACWRGLETPSRGDIGAGPPEQAGPRGAGQGGHGTPGQRCVHAKPSGPFGKAEQVCATGRGVPVAEEVRGPRGRAASTGSRRPGGSAGLRCPASRGRRLKAPSLLLCPLWPIAHSATGVVLVNGGQHPSTGPSHAEQSPPRALHTVLHLEAAPASVAASGPSRPRPFALPAPQEVQRALAPGLRRSCSLVSSGLH